MSMSKTVVGVALAALAWASPGAAEDTFDLLVRHGLVVDEARDRFVGQTEDFAENDKLIRTLPLEHVLTRLFTPLILPHSCIYTKHNRSKHTFIHQQV